MYIYKTTNLINNKIYIGLSTKTVEESTNYYGSGKAILQAIKKYGKDNFEKEILIECDTLEELRGHEIKLIAEYNSTDRNMGYNISPGGDTNPGKQKVGIYKYSIEGELIQYFDTIEDAVKLTGDKNLYRKKSRDNRPIKGFWYSVEPKTTEEILEMHNRYLTNRKESLVNGANKRYSDPKQVKLARKNMLKARTAVKNFTRSEETKQKISKSLTGRYWYHNPNDHSQNGQYHQPPSGWVRGRGKNYSRPSGLTYKNSKSK